MLVLVALLAALLASAQEASAQAPITLVSNVGQTASGTAVVEHDSAQVFRTGGHAGGYLIDSVEFRSNDAKTYDVSLWRLDSSGNPTIRVTDNFTRPSSYQTVRHVFTAPANTVLDASTRYALRIAGITSAADARPFLDTTRSDGEDADAVGGWSIDDAFLDRLEGAWREERNGFALRLRIKGHRFGVGSLVSNEGRTPRDTRGCRCRGSQTFVSGGSYTLTSIELADVRAFSRGRVSASIWTVNDQRLPRSKIRDLINRSSASTGRMVFTVPGGGLRVVNGGVYAVVLESSRGGAANLVLGTTRSDDHDPGAFGGWSIDNEMAWDNGGWTFENSRAARIRVNGHRGHRPGVPGDPSAAFISAGYADGERVLIGWSAASKGTADIAGYRIEVSTDAGASWSDLVADTASTDTSYTDIRAGPYDDVRYRVSAVSDMGVDLPSELGTGPPTDAFGVDPYGLPLVRNLGQAVTRSTNLSGVFSQSFQTGGTFTVASVELAYADAHGDELEASIWTVGADRLPRTKIRDLIPPDSFAAGTLEFAVPGGGLKAVRGGVYAVVFRTKGSHTDGVTLGVTTSDDEDAGAQSGWSIDNAHGASLIPGTWFAAVSESLRIGVKGNSGHAPAAPGNPSAGAIGGARILIGWTASSGTPAITGYRIEVSTDAGATWSDLVADTASTDTSYTDIRAGPYDDVRYRVSAVSALGTGPPGDAVSVNPLGVGLVSNSGQAHGSRSHTGTATSLAQSFSTGSGRFTLTGIELQTTAENTGMAASLWSANSDGSPNEKLFDFAIPGGSSGDTVVLVAPEHTEIGGSGSYTVVLDETGMSTVSVSATASSSEDGGAQPGWSIADDHWHKTGGTWTNQSSGPLRIAVKGASGVAPAQPTGLTALAFSRSRIELAWTAPADNGTTAISGYRIEVSADGETWTDLLANTASTDTAYSHTGIPAGAVRHYRVSAINTSGPGPPSQDASETANVLLRNDPDGTTGTFSADGIAAAVGFLTGTDDGVTGYLLDSVDFFYADDEGDTFTAALSAPSFSIVGALATPDVALTALVPPASFTKGRLSFSAPANTRLEPYSYYTVLLTYQGTGTNNSVDFMSTDSRSEGENEWQINSNTALRETASSSWTWRDEIARIAVRGEPIFNLVSNIGQSATSEAGLSLDIAQAFTTGSDSSGDRGFTVTGIGLNLGATDDSVTSATITIHRSNSDGEPGTSVGTLTRSAALVDNSVNSWTSSAGIDLAANTTYFIVIEGTGTSSASPGSLRLTSSDSEDSGAAAGWTIGNTSFSKSQGATSWTSASNAASMAVRGYARSGSDNNAPVFADTAATRSIPENTAPGQNVGAAVAATDADTEDTLAYTLGGTDAASFEIVSSSGQIRTKTGVSYDHEAKSDYTVTVTASDGAVAATATVTIMITDVDEPPAAPAAPTVTAVEGSRTSLSVSWTAPANSGRPDIVDYDVRYRRSGTASWTSGPQDTQSPVTLSGLSAGAVYRVQVRATNAEANSPWSPSGSGATDNYAPVFASATESRSLAENTPAGQSIGAAVSATDADAGTTLAYTLGGADAASFAIVSSSGQIRTRAGVSYDYEAKSDYTVTVTASDGLATATATVTITVTDVAEPPSAPAAPSVSGVEGSTTSLSVAWTAPANSGKPAISGYDLQYRQGTSGSWTVGPADVTGTAATLTGLDGNLTYEVQVRATNADGDGAWSASGSGVPGVSTASGQGGGGSRRHGTATLIVADGWSAADVGTAAALSARIEQSAVLYTHGDRLPSVTREVLADYRSAAVIIVGSTAAVSEQVESAGRPASDGARIERIAGATRTDTAELAARRAIESVSEGQRGHTTLIIANGWRPPDIGVAAVLSARTPDSAVLYTAADSLSPKTLAALGDSRLARVVIIGGHAAIHPSVEATIRDEYEDGVVIERVAGADRFATASDIAERILGSHSAGSAGAASETTVIVANGWRPPDIGVAAVLSARTPHSAVVFVEQARLTEPTEELLAALKPAQVVLIGGADAISPANESAVRSLLPEALVSRHSGATRADTAAAIVRRILGHP